MIHVNPWRLAAVAVTTLLLSLQPLVADTNVNQCKAIVVPADVSTYEKKAADTIVARLNRLYKIKVPIENAAPADGTAIFVGRAAIAAGLINKDELAKLKQDGFVMTAKAGKIGIAGQNDVGNLYASVFLTKKFGYEYIARDCFVANPVNTVPDFHESDAPRFEYRTAYAWQLGATIRDTIIGDPRILAKSKGRDYSNLWWHHNLGLFVHRDIHYDEHPEYFAMQTDGKRIPKTTSNSYLHHCLSNPGANKLLTDGIMEWIESQPERRYFWIHPGDGSQWCQCDGCKAMDVHTGNYSDRLVKWANPIARKVKAKYPDKVLCIAAYVGSEIGPVLARPDDNIMLFYCPYWGVALSMQHTLTHEFNIEALRQFESWDAVLNNQMAIYDYNDKNVFSWKSQSEKIQWAARRGVRAMYLCAKPRTFRDLFEYLTAHMLWDPTQDIAELKANFIKAYYGPAAPQMQAFTDAVEKHLELGFHKGYHSAGQEPEFYGNGFARKSIALFDEALAAAGDDSKIKNRIQKERDAFTGDMAVAVKYFNNELAEDLRKDVLELVIVPAAKELNAKKGEPIPPPKNGKKSPTWEQQVARFVRVYSGNKLPKDIKADAAMSAILANPSETLLKYAEKEPMAPTKAVDGMVKLTGKEFTGGFPFGSFSWMCPRRKNVCAVYSGHCPRPSEMTAKFTLDKAAEKAATLTIDGQGGDKDLLPETVIKIEVNGRAIFEGPCGYIKKNWSKQTYDIPADVLKQGENTLTISNVSASKRVDHFWFALATADIAL